MASNDFGSATINTDELLSTFTNARIGELIETIVGKSELREMFDANQDFQNEPGKYEGKPSGIIALDLGIVNSEVKTALLIIQASCRSVAATKKGADILAADDDAFKFVGSDNDPTALQEAQANWQLSHIVAKEIGHDELSQYGFAQAASMAVRGAALRLGYNGFKDAEANLNALSKVISPSTDAFRGTSVNLGATTPASYAKKLLGGEARLEASTKAIIEKLSVFATKQNTDPSVVNGFVRMPFQQ